jgi:glutamate racemase
MQRLGIIDWGIGGISVYKLVRERLGDIPVTYFSDTGATPYGKMSAVELAGRLHSVIDHLISEHKVTHLVIGCNAASTAIPLLADHGVPVLGVIEPGIELTANLAPQRLGLIGGRRTVVSGTYRRGFAARGIAVKQRIAQPLSAMIESGDTSSPSLRSAARQIVTPLRSCSHILLACTHYPAISGVIAELMPAATVLVDPAEAVIDKVRQWNISAGGRTEFLTTGDPNAMRTAAHAAFGVDIRSAISVSI